MLQIGKSSEQFIFKRAKEIYGKHYMCPFKDLYLYIALRTSREGSILRSLFLRFQPGPSFINVAELFFTFGTPT